MPPDARTATTAGARISHAHGSAAPSEPAGWGARILRTEVRNESEIRVFYTDTHHGEDSGGAEPDFETVRQLETGEWRLVAHGDLLQPSAIAMIVDEEVADLIIEE